MRLAVARITACALVLIAASPLLGGAQEVASSTVLLQQDRGRPANPLERRVTVHLTDVPLGEALRTLETLSSVRVSFSSDIVPVTKEVSVDLDDGTLREALRRVLEGTGLGVLVQAGNHLVLVKSPSDPVQGGTVAGRVTDAKTSGAIANVSVFLEGTRWRTTTGEDGAYRLVDVTAGTYTVTASRIGYTKQSQSVTVAAGQDQTLDLALQAAATELEQVVVTGTVVPTERKEIPTPISVITANEIEQNGYQRVDQIFRGDIPGAIAWDNGALSYVSNINIRGITSINFVPSVKTYIDGVEVSNPIWVATIDPNSIERIEVLRGPQASTIYGSAAIAGVMQIFTKKGELNTPHPQVEATASGGLIESPWVSGATVRQDYSLAVIGGGPDFSYRIGGGYLHEGQWAPEFFTNNTSLSGALRAAQGPATIELSARYYDKTFGWPLDPRLRDAGYTYYSKPFDKTEPVLQQTYGLTFSYATTPRWRHNLTLGYDRNANDQHVDQPRFTTPADSFVFASSIEESKASVAYNTTYSLSLGRTTRSSLTVGADHWTYHAGGFYAGNTTSSTNLIPSPNVGYRFQYSNSGYFAQEQLGFWDAVFVTAGLRAEDDQNFGKDFGLAWAPRAGVSYIRMFGNLTAKARVAYGKAIKPPSPGLAQPSVTKTVQQLGNPNLAPEQQVGPDGGLDLYFGSRGSVEATYYAQKVKDLIDYVLVNASSTPPTYQNQNVGRIKNEGWEFQGRLNVGRLSLSGTYSITSSTVQTLSSTYSGDLRLGDQMLAIPKHTAGATLSYILPRTTVNLGMTYVGSWTYYDYLALYGFFYGGQPYRGSQRAYWIPYASFSKFNLSVSHTVTDRLTAFLYSKNFTNNHVPEHDNLVLNAGRVTMIGVRTKL